MVRICPTCGGNQVKCPTCDMPPKRIGPKRKDAVGRILEILRDLAQPYATEATWEVQGVDISKWNGIMDLSITKTKCQYAYLRYGYGTQWKDSRVDTYYQDAIANDFPVGAYWYCNIGVDPVLTAQSFASLIAQKPPQLDVVLDAESTTLGMTETLNWLKTVDSLLTQLTGKKAMIYTAAYFWDAKVARSSYWVGRNLWVANWTNGGAPYMPKDWSSWLHWQWSADGNGRAKEYGMIAEGDYDMDLDRFNGTCSQFNARYGTHIVPIGSEPPPPPVVPEYVIVNSAVVNLRHSTVTVDQSNVCGTTTLGKKLYPEAIEYDTSGRKWYKLGKKVYIAEWLTRLP